MISSTSATVPGAGGGATAEGQGEEILEGLRGGGEDEVEFDDEVEVEVSVVVVSVAAAADDVRSLRRRCLLRERDPAAADLETRDRDALSGAAKNEAEAPRPDGAARRELEEEDATAAEVAVVETAATTTTRGGGRAAAPVMAAALIPQSQQRPRKAADGALIASVEKWSESAEALLS